MSSGNLDLGVLKWSIDADDAPFNAKLDRAEARVRSFGNSINSVVGGSGPIGGFGGPATFGGPISGGANTVGQIGRTGFAPPSLPALQALPPGRAIENEVWLAETKAWFGANASPATADVDPESASRMGGGRSFIRPVAAAYFAWRGISAISRAQEQNEMMDRVLARGTLDQQTALAVSQTGQRNQGVVAQLRNNWWTSRLTGTNYLNLIEGGTPEEQLNVAEDAAQSLRGQQAAQAAQAAARQIRLNTSAIGANPFQQIQITAQGTLNKVTDRAADIHQQAIRLMGRDSATANMLDQSATALREAGQRQYNRTVAHESWDLAKDLFSQGAADIQGIARKTYSGFVGFSYAAATANTAATGNEFGAQMTAMRGQFAQQEFGETNPVLKFMMKAAHAAILGAAQIGHERQLGFQTGQVTAATIGAEAQMPDIGIEESSRRERMAMYQRRDLELAQYKRENPADVSGYSARADYWKGQLELNVANEQAAVYRRDISTAGAIKSAQLVVAGRPLDAEINKIRTETAINVTAAGGPTTTAGQQQQQYGASREAAAQYQNTNAIEQLDLGITGQAKAYKQLLANPSDPIAAQSTLAAYSALAKAAELDKGGFRDQASGVLDNALSEQYLIQKDYLKSFRAFQFDPRDNVFNPRDTADIGKTLNSIDENIQKLADNLLVEQ